MNNKPIPVVAYFNLQQVEALHLSYEDILMLDKIRRERKGSC